MKKIYFSILIAFATGCYNLSFSQVYINENFNSGIPATWSISTASCVNSSSVSTMWMNTTNGWRGLGLTANSLNGTEFAVVDSDLPGTFCQCNEFLTSPVFNATPSATTTLFLKFEQFFRYYSGSFAETGEVQVFNGTSWIVVATFTSTQGAWTAPNMQSINITPHINANMQIRFRYNANWDWFWALDNIRVEENTATGSQEVSAAEEINIFPFPNPSAGIFTIRSGNKMVDANITIKNILGEEIYSYNSINLNDFSINLTDKSNGIYFVEIKMGDEMITKKIIKQ